jgi:hypothetical protein
MNSLKLWIAIATLAEAKQLVEDQLAADHHLAASKEQHELA